MISLVLGGARSGKSEMAERLAASLPQPVTYLATAAVEGDPDFAARVDRHRARRPPGWVTVEAGPALVERLAEATGTILVDSLGTWVAAVPGFAADCVSLCSLLRSRPGDAVVVSEEVGLGVHPSTEVGGRFRDALGVLNRAVSEVADEVYLVVAGRPVRLDGPPVPSGAPFSPGGRP